jgi:hypothetical protein
MNPVLAAVIGLLVGVVVLGLGVFFYVAVGAIKNLTASIRILNTTLGPIFAGEDLPRTLKVLQALGALGTEVGAKIDTLNSTMGMFTRAVFNTPERPVANSTPEGNSGVFAYSEEDAAARGVATKLRKAGIETDESVVIPPADLGPAPDLY